MGLFSKKPEPEPIQSDDYFVAAGTKYRQRELSKSAKRRGWVLPDVVGDPKFGPTVVVLLPQPNNPNDPNAIAVCDPDARVMIGWVPRDETGRVQALIDAGGYKVGKATAQALYYKGQHGGWQVRVLV